VARSYIDAGTAFCSPQAQPWTKTVTSKRVAMQRIRGRVIGCNSCTPAKYRPIDFVAVNAGAKNIKIG